MMLTNLLKILSFPFPPFSSPHPLLQVDSKGQNFLHLAILKQDVEAVIFLMSVEVDVNSKVKNPTLNTALHYAIKGGSEILVRHLVSEGQGQFNSGRGLVCVG